MLNSFLFFLLCWVFIAAHRLSLVAGSRGYSLVVMLGLFIVLASLGPVGSVAEVHWFTCPLARGILPDQGLNLCPLHQQADSHPLDHQGHSKHAFLEDLFDCCVENGLG